MKTKNFFTRRVVSFSRSILICGVSYQSSSKSVYAEPRKHMGVAGLKLYVSGLGTRWVQRLASRSGYITTERFQYGLDKG
jgi:hypothetical protein